MKPIKFMLYGDELRMARVEFHRDLLPDNFDRTKIHGGGYARVDKDRNAVILSDSSFEFGPFDADKVPAEYRGMKVEIQL